MKGFDPRGKTVPEHRLLALPDKSSRPSALSRQTLCRPLEMIGMIPLPPKTLPPEPEPAVQQQRPGVLASRRSLGPSDPFSHPTGTRVERCWDLGGGYVPTGVAAAVARGLERA